MQTNKNSLNNLSAANTTKRKCVHCDRECTIGNIGKHEKACSKNPANMKECPVCGTHHSKKGVTCSYSCSNTYFRSGKDNPNYDNGGKYAYRRECFEEHGKKCIVCGEEKIVAAHHVNGDHHDDRVENLVPLCPTHHQYLHSRYKDEVQPIVDDYLGWKYSERSVEVT